MKMEIGSVWKYIPRGTTYKIVLKDVEIKCDTGWETGCLYVCKVTGKMFCRSYSSFLKGINKWEEVDERV
ncbi:hypothetical protein NVP1193O_201 [Vibrio phage 1.193.O._10N.286.52.C6]|nr:hypothetical protein NVP1193O_201 [Vibrio phage 1.193.O._10N.286.52.C6]